MYKCRVCNLEYESKPDYCECGNDTFDEMLVENQPRQLPLKHIISVVIFVILLLLSILIWFEKPTQKSSEKTPTTQKITTKIPDIETIWNNTPPKNIQSGSTNVIMVYEQPDSEPEPQKQTSIQTPKKLSAPKTVVKKSQTNPAQKPTTQPAQSFQKPVPQEQTAQKSQIPPKTVKITPPPEQSPEPPVQLKTMNSQEWNTFKNSLRFTLLSKLNVVNINGQGDCAIQFSFDNNGKLLNRKFIYKSENKTVNDEVYIMLMKLPTFKTPPEGYNGETVKMKFRFDNGHYEISFMN